MKAVSTILCLALPLLTSAALSPSLDKRMTCTSSTMMAPWNAEASHISMLMWLPLLVMEMSGAFPAGRREIVMKGLGK